MTLYSRVLFACSTFFDVFAICGFLSSRSKSRAAQRNREREIKKRDAAGDYKIEPDRKMTAADVDADAPKRASGI